MNPLLRIVFAVIIGALVYALLAWLVPAIPQLVSVLIGIAAGFITYFYGFRA